MSSSSSKPALRGSVSALVALSALLAGSATGCHSGSNAAATEAQGSLIQQQQANNTIRQQMDAIPPPVKSKFMAIKSLDSWENPYLTVQENVLVLHVIVADANSSPFGQGGLLRPINARRQTLTIRVSELPSALNAIPVTAWPYGRVVAVEEAHGVPARAEPQVRRNMEQTMRTLSDLGVVMYEWSEGGPGLR